MTAVPELSRVSDYVAHYAAARPDAVALVAGNDRIPYAAFRDRVDRMAAALIAAGVKKGDRVAMLCPPQPDFMVAFMATASIGAIWLGLNPRYKLGEFEHVVREVEPTLMLARTEIEGRDYRGDLAALKAGFACIERIVTLDSPMAGADGLDGFLALGETVGEGALKAARDAVGTDDTAVIIFTSGSTGAPKGAMLTHYGLVRGARTENAHWPPAHGSPVVMGNFPINHIAGLGMTMGYGIVAGGTVVFQERFDAGEALRLIAVERITFLLQAPTMFHFMVNHPDFAKTDISSVEHIIWAGSAMAEDLIHILSRLGARLSTAFGMTELSTYVTYSDPDAPAEVLCNTIGRPERRYELRLADGDGNPAALGAEAEIQARGRWILKGYYGKPEATREAFTPDGWFRTGDTAVELPDGNWRLVGRIKEMYKSGGYNIYPREIEIAIEAHPDVAMAAVLGVADPVFQEVGHAFVQPEPGARADAEALRLWCAERLANYKVPKQFTVMRELPRLPIGKLDKMALRRQLDNG